MSTPNTPHELLADARALLLKVEAGMSATHPITATATEADWLRFLHSLALSDHLGDAANAVRGFAELAGLPMPPDDADFDQWGDWCAERGIEDGVHSELLRRQSSTREEK